MIAGLQDIGQDYDHVQVDNELIKSIISKVIFIPPPHPSPFTYYLLPFSEKNYISGCNQHRDGIFDYSRTLKNSFYC